MNITEAQALCTSINRTHPELHPVVGMMGSDYVVKLQSMHYRRWMTDFVIWSIADWNKYIAEKQLIPA